MINLEQQVFSYNTATVWCKVVLMFECIWNICGEEFHKLDSGPSYSWVYSNACFGAHMDLHLSHYTATKYTKKPQMVLLVCLLLTVHQAIQAIPVCKVISDFVHEYWQEDATARAVDNIVQEIIWYTKYFLFYQM